MLPRHRPDSRTENQIDEARSNLQKAQIWLQAAQLLQGRSAILVRWTPVPARVNARRCQGGLAIQPRCRHVDTQRESHPIRRSANQPEISQSCRTDSMHPLCPPQKFSRIGLLGVTSPNRKLRWSVSFRAEDSPHPGTMARWLGAIFMGPDFLNSKIISWNPSPLVNDWTVQQTQDAI